MSEVIRYQAAGGVVVHASGRVMVLERSSRGEVRLPKGHIDPGESPRETALREVGEESGFEQLRMLADLGRQHVAFHYQGKTYERDEFYFLMLREGSLTPDHAPEAQFRPRWVPWDEAEALLTFESEREWVRRARRLVTNQP